MGTLSQITKYSGDELKGSIVRLRSDRGFESRNIRLFWCHLGHFLADYGGARNPPEGISKPQNTSWEDYLNPYEVILLTPMFTIMTC